MMANFESDNTSNYLDICLNAFRKSTTDMEKFASLYVLYTTIKRKQTSLQPKHYNTLFQSIDHQFLKRLLLQTNDTIDGNDDDAQNEYIYQQISLSILSSFYLIIGDQIDCDLSVELLTTMTTILEKLNDNKNKTNILSEIEKQLIVDIIICFDSFFTQNNTNNNKQINDQSIQLLFDTKFTAILLELCEQQISDKFDENITKLLSKIASIYDWSSFDSLSFNKYMRLIAEPMKLSRDKRKFELCTDFDNYLQRNTIDINNELTKGWVNVLSESLYDIFRSRLSKPLRDPAIKLASTLTEKCGGFNWISNNVWTEKTARFLLLIIRLSCIEISVNFESENIIDMSCVANCFVLLEFAIIALCEDEESNQIVSHLTNEQIINALNAIKDAMNFVLKFLKLMSDESVANSDDERFIAILSCIRMTFVWITEETESLRDEIADILPFILRVIKMKKDVNSIDSIFITALSSLVDSEEKFRLILRNDENIDEILNHIRSESTDREINESCAQLKQMIEK